MIDCQIKIENERRKLDRSFFEKKAPQKTTARHWAGPKGFGRAFSVKGMGRVNS